MKIFCAICVIHFVLTPGIHSEKPGLSVFINNKWIYENDKVSYEDYIKTGPQSFEVTGTWGSLLQDDKYYTILITLRYLRNEGWKHIVYCATNILGENFEKNKKGTPKTFPVLQPDNAAINEDIEPRVLQTRQVYLQEAIEIGLIKSGKKIGYTYFDYKLPDKDELFRYTNTVKMKVRVFGQSVYIEEEAFEQIKRNGENRSYFKNNPATAIFKIWSRELLEALSVTFQIISH